MMIHSNIKSKTEKEREIVRERGGEEGEKGEERERYEREKS